MRLLRRRKSTTRRYFALLIFYFTANMYTSELCAFIKMSSHLVIFAANINREFISNIHYNNADEFYN